MNVKQQAIHRLGYLWLFCLLALMRAPATAMVKQHRQRAGAAVEGRRQSKGCDGEKNEPAVAMSRAARTVTAKRGGLSRVSQPVPQGAGSFYDSGFPGDPRTA